MDLLWARLPADLRRYVIERLPEPDRYFLRLLSRWWRDAVDSGLASFAIYDTPPACVYSWLSRLSHLVHLELYFNPKPIHRLCRLTRLQSLHLSGVPASAVVQLVSSISGLTALDVEIDRLDRPVPVDLFLRMTRLRRLVFHSPDGPEIRLRIPPFVEVLDVENVEAIFSSLSSLLPHLYYSADVLSLTLPREVPLVALALDDCESHAGELNSVLTLSLASLQVLCLGDSTPATLFRHLHAAPQLQTLMLQQWWLPDDWRPVVSDLTEWLETYPPRFLRRLFLPRLSETEISDAPVALPAGVSDRERELASIQSGNYYLEAADRAWRAMCTHLGDSLVDLEWSAWSCSVDSLQLLTNFRRLHTFQQHGGDDALELPWLFRFPPTPNESRKGECYALATHISAPLLQWLLQLRCFSLSSILSYESYPYFHDRESLLLALRKRWPLLSAELREIDGLEVLVHAPLREHPILAAIGDRESDDEADDLDPSYSPPPPSP